MKRFCSRVFLFLTFTIAFYILFIIFFGSFSHPIIKKNIKYKQGAYGYLYARLKEADTTHNIDILFLGSSHAYRGYDTRVFAEEGFRSFNLGSSAQTPLQTEVLVDKYLNQFNPKLVILDIYPDFFKGTGVESALDLIANSQIDIPMVKMALKLDNIIVYNTLIYGFYRQVFTLNAKFNGPPPNQGNGTYIPGGYVDSFEQYESSTGLKKIRYKISTIQLDAFKRILQVLKKRNIRYVLIQSPYAQNRYNAIINNDETDAVFSKLGTYYNINKIMVMPDSLFFDSDHLNHFGVEVFNSKLIEVMHTELNLLKAGK